MGLQLLLGLSQVHRKGMGPTFLRKWNRFFFFLEPSSDKNFEQGWVGGREGGWLRSKACKFLASGPNQPRGPRRGGETSASFLNWSHWDPQGSPRRTHRKAIKIWPCGSDKELGGKKAKKKKDGFGGEKQKEQRGTVGERSQLRQIKGRQGRQEGWAHSPRVHPGNTVCQWRDRAGRAGAISYQTHVTRLMMCSTNPTWVYLYPAQVLAAETLDRFVLAWDQTLDEAGVVIHSHVGPQRNKRYQSNPETPQPARHTADLPSPLQEHTTTQWGGVCVLSDSMDVFYSTIWSHYWRGPQSSKEENSTIISLLCSQMSWLKPDEKIMICKLLIQWVSAIWIFSFQSP